MCTGVAGRAKVTSGSAAHSATANPATARPSRGPRTIRQPQTKAAPASRARTAPAATFSVNSHPAPHSAEAAPRSACAPSPVNIIRQ